MCDHLDCPQFSHHCVNLKKDKLDYIYTETETFLVFILNNLYGK